MFEKTKLMVGDVGRNEIDSFNIDDLFKQFRCTAQEMLVLADVGSL